MSIEARFFSPAIILSALIYCAGAPASDVLHKTILLDDGNTEPVHYYVYVPPDYSPDKPCPLLYCVPGAGMNKGEVDKNQSINYVKGFVRSGLPDFIIYSIWFNDPSATYPHWTKQRAVDASVKVMGEMLAEYNIDTELVFMEFFSGGGAYASKYPFGVGKDKMPVTAAGFLFTSANYRGVNARAACVRKDTSIFIEVGDRETREYGLPCDLIKEARGYESSFIKDHYTEFHLIPGQGHVMSKEAHEKITAFVRKVQSEIIERRVERVISARAKLESDLRRGKFGKVLSALGMAATIDTDNKAVEGIKAMVKVLSDAAEKLKKQAESDDPAQAAMALVLLEKLYDGYSAEDWAKQETKRRKKADRKFGKAVITAKRKYKKPLQAKKEEILSAVDSVAVAGK